MENGSKKSGGGELLDQGSHLIDLLIYLSDKDFEVEYAKPEIFFGVEKLKIMRTLF